MAVGIMGYCFCPDPGPEPWFLTPEPTEHLPLANLSRQEVKCSASELVSFAQFKSGFRPSVQSM